MELITTPVALPGCCFQCGNAERQFYVDTGRSMEFHGAVYYCNECLAEMAHAAGYLIPEEADKLRTDILAALSEIERLNRVNDGLEKVVDGLLASRGSLRIDTQSNVVAPNEPAEQEPPVGSEHLDIGTRTAPEPLHDERVAIVPDDEPVTRSGEFSLGL
jgi:hypothetical protein